MLFTLLPVSVFLGVLVGAVAYRPLHRHRPASRVLPGLAAGAGAFTLVLGVAIGVALGALFEPWALSLPQGPHTEFARECFERHLGEMAPRGVRDLYCRDEWGFGGDSIYSLRFTFKDRELVSRVVDRLELEPVEPETRSRVRYLAGPDWWSQEQDLAPVPAIYQRQGFTFLWLDEEAGEACFQKAGF